MIDKVGLRKDQVTYIDEVRKHYSISLTEIAVRSGIVSTTLTRFYNGAPKHVLSTTTLAKIRDKFPLQIQKTHEIFTDTEVGLMSAIRAVIVILSNYDVIQQNDLKNVFTYQQKDFRMRAQPGAAAVMDQLIEFLNDSPPPKTAQKAHKPLSPAQGQ